MSGFVVSSHSTYSHNIEDLVEIKSEYYRDCVIDTLNNL